MALWGEPNDPIAYIMMFTSMQYVSVSAKTLHVSVQILAYFSMFEM